MLPNRKKNRLADYSYSQPGAYFITVCTTGKRCILGTVVGAGDHTGPQRATPVGAGDHTGPQRATPVGAGDHTGPRTQLTEIGKVVEKYTRLIPGVGDYIIMPNHVHMILRVSADKPQNGPMWSSAPTSRNVETSIRTWKTLITKELGESIWQRSYYDHVIRDQNDYNIRVQYIRENPSKWFFDDYYTP